MHNIILSIFKYYSRKTVLDGKMFFFCSEQSCDLNRLSNKIMLTKQDDDYFFLFSLKIHNF